MSKSEFLRKHKAKYDREGLSVSDRTKRYDDYLSSSADQGDRSIAVYGGRRKTPSVASKSGAAPRTYSFNHVNAEAEWLKSILDPFTHLVRQPDATPLPTATAQIKQPIVVRTDANGRFIFLMRDSLRLSRSNSWSDLDGLGAYGWAYGSAGWYMPIGTGPVNQYNGNLATNWIPLDEFQSIQEIFQSYRVVSMGLEFDYIAPPTTAQGQLVGGLWTPWENYPAVNTVGISKSFTDLKEEQFSHVEPAINGIRVHGLPNGQEVTRFRKSYWKQQAGYATNQINSIDEIGFNWNSAMMVRQQFSNNATTGWFVAPTSSGAATVDLASGPNGPFSQEGYLDMWDHCGPDQFLCPYVAGEGMVASTDVLAGFAVYNLEVVIDESTLRTAVGTFDRQANHASGDVGKVSSIASLVPAAGPAGSTKAAKVGSYLKKAASAGQKLVSGGKTRGLVEKIAKSGASDIDVSEVLDTVGEIASAVLAVF